MSPLFFKEEFVEGVGPDRKAGGSVGNSLAEKKTFQERQFLPIVSAPARQPLCRLLQPYRQMVGKLQVKLPGYPLSGVDIPGENRECVILDPLWKKP